MCNIYSIKDQTMHIYFVLISKYICMYKYIAIYCQWIYCCILKNISTSFQYIEMYYVIYHIIF